MRVRMRFSKEKELKFIGHLDTMRYFQKLMRRASIPIAYSQGMSPHQIMSFALPLGIGEESIGEYVDIELTESVSSTKALTSLTSAGIDEIRVFSFKELPDGALNAMASVWAADYELSFVEADLKDLSGSFASYMAQNEIVVMKKTKKSERELDIKPFIFDWKVRDDRIILRLKCGSVDNTKPELVMKGFYDYMGLTFDEMNLKVKRLDLLTLVDDTLVSLDEIGKEIEA